MMTYEFPNPDHDPWLDKYNELVKKVKAVEIDFSKFPEVIIESTKSNGKTRKVGLGKHHIIPRSIRPELTKDPGNIIEIPFSIHMDLHYFLWKANPEYARQLWFGCVFGRKHHLWDLPDPNEYDLLKSDLKSKKPNIH